MPKRKISLGTYQHWKGGLYKVVGVVLIDRPWKEGDEGTAQCSNLALDALATSDLMAGDIAVVYSNIDSNATYLREQENFLEVLGDKDEGNQYYRFMRVAVAEPLP